MRGKNKMMLAGTLLMAFITVSAENAFSKENSIDPAAMTAAHHKWRSKAGVPDLKWSDELADTAQKWADHMAETSCTQGHSGVSYGENIYWASPITRSDGSTELQKKTPQDAVDAWGNEIKDYDYTDNSCHKVCGHYTQVVWKSTTEVGCGMAVCGDKAQIWVCNYSPPGNMIGQKPY